MIGPEGSEVRFKIRFSIYMIFGASGLGMLLGLINIDIFMNLNIDKLFYSKVMIYRFLEIFGLVTASSDYSTSSLKMIAGSDYQLFLSILNNFEYIISFCTLIGAATGAIASIITLSEKSK